jgi:hypothetical protein
LQAVSAPASYFLLTALILRFTSNLTSQFFTISSSFAARIFLILLVQSEPPGYHSAKYIRGGPLLA